MLVSTKMITGFNTDVSHEGRVYHVQTEDRGADNPIFESLVYVGGSIVAKKLTPYSDKLSEGATEEALASLLKRQHQVIIAAIKAGRIDDLIRHSREGPSRRKPSTGKLAGPSSPPPVEPSGTGPLIPVPDEALIPLDSNKVSPRASGKLKLNKPATQTHGNTGTLDLDQVISDYLERDEHKLEVKVLAPDVFIAGKSIGLRVQVAHETKLQFDAVVTVKIIGTAFRPQVVIARVGKDGVANFSLTLPSFNAGTAAIVIEARSSAGRGELKNLIRRAGA